MLKDKPDSRKNNRSKMNNTEEMKRHLRLLKSKSQNQITQAKHLKANLGRSKGSLVSRMQQELILNPPLLITTLLNLLDKGQVEKSSKNKL
jgi:hypothetical protein